MQRKMREGAAGGVFMDAAEANRLAMLRAAGENIEGPARGALPMHGNLRTYNIDDLLVNSILQSEYFRDLTYVARVCCWACGLRRKPCACLCIGLCALQAWSVVDSQLLCCAVPCPVPLSARAAHWSRSTRSSTRFTTRWSTLVRALSSVPSSLPARS